MLYLIVGTRPNYIKAFPIYKYLKKQNVKIKMIHSNQHYDDNLNKIFFEELEIPIDEILFLEKKKNIMEQLLLLFKNDKPTYIMVFGDVNTSLYGAIAGIHNNIPIIHIESGLRSFDNTMIEELNRKAIDSISSLHFCTEKSGVNNLINENITSNIFFVGNTMIDTLMTNLQKIKRKKYFRKLDLDNYQYIICTIHRQNNVDDKKKLNNIMNILNDISKDYHIDIVIPLHPRTEKNLDINLYPNLLFTKPLSYIKFMSLVYYSRCIITDSGGIQEETTFLNKKCLTLRDNTERPITITEGTNKLVELDYKIIVKNLFIEDYKNNINIKYWDGDSSKRIYEILHDKNILQYY